MFVTGLLECLAKILFFIIPSIFDDLTWEDLVDVDIGIDLDKVGKCWCTFEFELSDKLTIWAEGTRVDKGFKDVVKERNSSWTVSLCEEGLWAPYW